MTVIAYSYDADYHCEKCMLDYAHRVPYNDYVWGEYTDEDIASNMPGIMRLDKAVELEIIRDGENNPIHPVFSTDEWWEPSIPGLQILACSDCATVLDSQDVE
jgi:hypothetical protein